jgi:hypothetical protein
MVWNHHVGHTPDIPVSLPANNPAGSDPILDRALQVLAAAPSADVPGAVVPAERALEHERAA